MRQRLFQRHLRYVYALDKGSFAKGINFYGGTHLLEALVFGKLPAA